MDDLNAFERQLRNEVQRAFVPARPVDVASIVRTAATTSPKWRFQSMFSATKFVVAGVIVALFGGFLLAGVLTQQGDESLPTVGASASEEAEVNTDLLPGVDLVTEEVSPGVYRVLGDGERSLRENVWQVAVSPEGDVWVEKHRVDGYDNGDSSTRNHRVIRLGEPAEYFRGDRSLRLGSLDDGAVAVTRPRDGGQGKVFTFDGQAWVERPEPASDCDAEWVSSPDGSCWFEPGQDGGGYRPYLERVDSSGETRVFTRTEVGLEEGENYRGHLFVSPGGTIWAPINAFPGVGFATFDGQQWSRVSLDDYPEDLRPEDPNFSPSGMVWVLFVDWDSPGTFIAKSWDGSEWTTYGPIPGHPTGIHFLPDDSVWFGTLAVVDGTDLQQVPLPASATNRQPGAQSVARTTDGTYWVAVIDRDRHGPPRCPRIVGEWPSCDGATDGLYIVTPEAAMTAE